MADCVRIPALVVITKPCAPTADAPIEILMASPVSAMFPKLRSIKLPLVAAVAVVISIMLDENAAVVSISIRFSVPNAPFKFMSSYPPLVSEEVHLIVGALPDVLFSDIIQLRKTTVHKTNWCSIVDDKMRTLQSNVRKNADVTK